MTVQQLRPPTDGSVTGAPVLGERVAAARASVVQAAAVSPGSLADWQIGEALASVTALEAQVASLRLALLGEAEQRRVAEQSGATGTDAWAAQLTGSTRAVMAGGLRLARLLRETYAATREAFAAGRIGVDQVRVIVNAAERLPAKVTPAQRAEAEQVLVDKAVAGIDPGRLRQAARRMLERIDRELADEHEADQLEKEQQRAEAETWLSLRDNGDGTVSGRFTIPELHAALLRAALEKLTAPRRWSRNKAGQPVVDDTVPGEGPTLSWTERLGAGFCELLEHLPTAGHGPVGATVVVHLDYAHLLDALASARIDTGIRISPGEARRLACGSGIVPMVLGGASEPLDVGREQRLHNAAMRRGLSARYETCAAEGCQRPFAWCEIHHPHAWSKGGRTSIANALPVCGHHHRRLHDSRYRHTLLPSGEIRFRRRT